VRFLSPELFLLFIPALIVMGLAVRSRRKRRLQLAALGDRSLIDALIESPLSNRRVIVRHGLWLLAAFALVLALARPVWGQEIEPVPTGDVAVMLMLDVSRSMNAQDIAPSRLERARLFAADIARRLRGAEVGLMLFAGRAIVQAPLTTDLNSIELFIRNASSIAIQRQGTNFQEAFDIASRNLNSPYATSRYILLLTDGEDHSEGLEAALQSLREQQINVIAVGIGTEQGAAVPSDSSGAPLRDRDGTEVVSRLNPTELRSIADQIGGSYWSLTDAEANAEAFARVFASSTAGEGGTGSNVIEVERFALFILLALVALALETGLSMRRLPKARAVPS
jgi:Ca-activated chloride channel family protein